MHAKAALALCTILLTCGAVQAGFVFQEDFEGYAPGLNWTGAGVWSISDGTVDLIGTGTSWNYFPAYGKYVDLDGSTQNPGLLQSPSITLGPGIYRVSYFLAGNQRSAGNDDVTVQVSFGSYSTSHTIGQSDAFAEFSYTFTVASSMTGTLSFENSGSDNMGALLDNVSIQVIPAPAAVLLGVIGLSLVASLKRRG